MMTIKDLRNEPRIFKRLITLLAICVSTLAVKPAIADVPLPPPSAQVQTVAAAPNGSTVTINDGRFQIGFKNGSQFPQHYGSLERTASYTNGLKTHPATFKDTYGNVATGRINTASTIRPSALDGAVKGYLAADLAGKVLNSQAAHNAMREAANGNYDTAALNAAAAFDVFGIGAGINALKDTFRDAQLAKAQEHLQFDIKNTAYDASQKEAFVMYSVPESHLIGEEAGKTVHFVGYKDVHYCCSQGPNHTWRAHKIPSTGNPWDGLVVAEFQVNEGRRDLLHQVLPNDPNLFRPQITPEQLMLTQAEIQNILLQQLADQNSVLNQNTDALKDLINYLIANGGLNPADLPTTVTGSETDRTFVSDAYTPAGQDVAQQTKFVVNPDGSVTVSTVPRPDLHPNSSQAPTRQPIGTPTKRPRPDFEDDDDVDICENNPNILACLEPGSADYEDIVLPTDERKLEFKTDDVFASYGTCPAPTSVQVINSRIELSYQPMCDMAARLRSLVIFLGVAASMFMVWRTLNG